jgi:hypothetical protein
VVDCFVALSLVIARRVKVTTPAMRKFADARLRQEIACLVRQFGYEPVWKDWDAALMAAN